MKQKYYITLNPQEMEIGQIRDDSQLIQYEIEVNEQELIEVKQLIQKYRYELYDVADILFHSFHERDVTEDKYQSLDNLEQLFQLIYKYGTVETKHDLENIKEANNNLN